MSEVVRQELPNKVIIERDAKHHYRVIGDPKWEGQVLPSVTTVLNVINRPALIPWAKKISLEKVRMVLLERVQAFQTEGLALNIFDDEEDIEKLIEEARKLPDNLKQEAADFGSETHNLIEQIIAGKETEIPEHQKQAIENFIAWREQSGLTITLSERMVYHSLYGYAGTFDAVATDAKGQTYVVDWKSSRAIYREMHAQIGAYAFAYMECYGEMPHGGLIIRFGKTEPEFEPVAINAEELRNAFRGFRGALMLHRWLKEERIASPNGVR